MIDRNVKQREQVIIMMDILVMMILEIPFYIKWYMDLPMHNMATVKMKKNVDTHM